MKSVSRSRVVFDFVGYGTQVASTEVETSGLDRLYLDVGNELRPGVIDHHHLAALTGSTARLVLEHPELIAVAVNPARGPSDPLTIVLHEDPDLDCLVSAYLAVVYIRRGAFPPHSELLVSYVDEVDAGYLGLSRDNPYSLYTACMLLAHRLSQRNWENQKDMWRVLVRQGLDVLTFVMKRVSEDGVAVLDVDAFACPQHFGPADRHEIQKDIERYQRKLADAKCHARRLKLALPRQIGGTSEVDALFVRDVQNDDDPHRVMFFKDWARTDAEHSASGQGFTALSVFHSTSMKGTPRAILSVKPESRVCLRGLGRLLDEAESAERIRLHGFDDRVEDPETHELKEKRKGYDNSDPWYDGRSHALTIVDSPRSGTTLSAERIEEIFLEFGRRKDSAAESLGLPSLSDLSPRMGADSDQLRRMSLLAESYRREFGHHLVTRPPDIFISYPRTKLNWVVENIYEPLKDWRGANRVFFDKETLQPGAGWLATLAEAVYKCRVFVPIYSTEYFRSVFCQWELQLAIRRDPTGAKRIVMPILVEEVPLPHYCSLIQCIDASRVNIKSGIVDLLSKVLVD